MNFLKKLFLYVADPSFLFFLIAIELFGLYTGKREITGELGFLEIAILTALFLAGVLSTMRYFGYRDYPKNHNNALQKR